ncbi:hypothetical protein [Lacticaseibacillus mingshuiensis]|uniref:hypothetical protein n=1 Tax=Lacticaseibacillus mingshuiensis TaxID=2799574 RepID=UPI001950B3A6|nr:hypothetical protein [Lacticaseibacillus mingshuiensis]
MVETRVSRSKQRKPLWKSWKLWLLLVFIFLLATGISNCVNEFKKETASPSTKIYKLDSDRSVKAMLKHYNSEIKYENISGIYANPDGSKTVGLSIKETGSDLSDKMAMRNAANDILKTWDAFKKSKGTDFANIAIMVTYPTDDGQIPIIKTQLNGNKLKSFNKSSSSASSVPKIATEYWQRNDMPSIK